MEKYMITGPGNSQSLLLHMRDLYNNNILTTWEFTEFINMCIARAKNTDGRYQFDKDTEEFWQTEEQYHRK